MSASTQPVVLTGAALVSAAAREWFSPDEVARLVGRAAYSVREWCRLGRIQARKRDCGRGRYLAWAIHVDQVRFYLDHGLRPIPKS